MPKESLETLIPELVHEEDWRRMRATSACLAGGPKAVDGLIHALETGSDALKIESAGMLARIKDPHGGVPLVRLLRDPDQSVRFAGKISLEQMAGILLADTAAALVEDLHELKDEEQQRMVTSLLAVIPNAIEPLIGMLKHADQEARVMAATILEHLLDPRSADAMVDTMGDPALQEIAVRTLKKLGAIRNRIDNAFNALRSIEEPVEREELRMEVVTELLGIGRPSVELLIEYLRDDDWVVREAAADLLGKIADVRSVEPLMERVREDKDTGVKELAVKALGLIGDSRPVGLLVEVFPIRPLRVYAIEALAGVKDVEVLRPYEDFFKEHQTSRDGLISYHSGGILNKLAAASQADSSAEEGGQAEDE